MRPVVAACALLSLTLVHPSPAAPPVQSIHRHFDPADRESGRYQYVPFEVAAGAEGLTITYRYSGDDGTNVIDLGLFEPGSVALGTPAFRGYSGGAQRTITVGRSSASPGYRTGPLPPGEWHVLLGLYRIGAGGVDVAIDVSESRLASPANAPAPEGHAAGRLAAERRWYSGALHTHTTHSDGTLSPAALAETARATGLDFIAVTDHNTTSHTREAMPAPPLHIVGEELTTPGGHANVWGLPAGAWIDFRVSPPDAGAATAIAGFVEQAHRGGGLFSISHPIDECAGCSWQQAVPDALDAIEIWNGSKGPQEAAIAMWDRLLRAGRRVTGVGASDWHRRPAAIDAPAVRVLSDGLSQAAVLDGIRQGRVVVVRDSRIDTPTVRAVCAVGSASTGDTLACRDGESIDVHVGSTGPAGGRADLFWTGARSQSKPIERDIVFSIPAARGYLRVHLYAADGSTAAITNPIHVTVR